MSSDQLSPVAVPRDPNMSRPSNNGTSSGSAHASSAGDLPNDPPTSPHINHTIDRPPVKLSATKTKRSLTGTPLIRSEGSYQARRSTYSSLQRITMTKTRSTLQPPYSAGAQPVVLRRPEIPVLDPDVDAEVSDDSSPIKRGSKVAGLHLAKVYHNPGHYEPPAKYPRLDPRANHTASLPQAPPSTRDGDVTIVPLPSRLVPPTDYITPERWTEPVAKLPPANQHVRITSPTDQDTTSPLKTKTEAHNGVVHDLLSPGTWEEDLDKIRLEYRRLADNLYQQLETKHDRITILETDQKRYESELLRARQRAQELEVELKTNRIELQLVQKQSDHHSHQFNLLNLEYEQLREDLDEREARISQMEDEKARIEAVLTQLQEKLSETEHELNNSLTNYDQTREQLVDLQGQFDELVLQEKIYKDEIDELHRKIKTYEDQQRLHEAERSDLRRRLAETQDKVADLEAQNAQLERESAQARDVMRQVQQMEEGLNNLEQVLTESEERNAQLTKELDQEKQTHREQINQLKADHNDVTRQLEAAYAEKQQLRKRDEAVLKQVREKQDEIAQLNRDIRQWEQRYHELSQIREREVSELQSQVDNASHLHQAHANEINEVKAKHDDELRIQADKHARERQKFEDEIRNLKAEADRALASQAEIDRDWQQKWDSLVVELAETHDRRLQEVEQYLHAEYGRKHQEKVKLIKEVHQANMEALQQKVAQAEARAEKFKEDLDQYMAAHKRSYR